MRSTERRHPTLCLRRFGRSLDLLDSYFISSLRLSRKRQPHWSLPEKCGALKVCSGSNGADSMCSCCTAESGREEQPPRRAAAEKLPHPLHVQLQHGRVRRQPRQMEKLFPPLRSPVQILNCKHQLLSNSRLEKGLSLKHPAQSSLS